MRCSVWMAGVALLLLGSAVAHADGCKLTIESNDQMQFSARQLTVPPACSQVELTLRNVGKLPVRVMGHDWVLARDTDMQAVVTAGLAAGFSHGFLAPDDQRVIAATALVGGGQSATIQFSTSGLIAGERYAFFCTSPGHSSVMRGRLIFGESGRLAQAGKPLSQPR